MLRIKFQHHASKIYSPRIKKQHGPNETQHANAPRSSAEQHLPPSESILVPGESNPARIRSAESRHPSRILRVLPAHALRYTFRIEQVTGCCEDHRVQPVLPPPQGNCRATEPPRELIRPHAKLGRRRVQYYGYMGGTILPGTTEWLLNQYCWPNSVMFHYTSRVAFESILSSRRMWAMDLRTMKDPRELMHGKAVIDKRLIKAAKRFRGTPTETWLSSLQRLFGDVIVRQSSSFSISLSEHPDMANQWRDYAAQGSGFVLGWSIDSDYPGVPLKTWVTYGRQKQMDVIDGLIDRHATALSQGIAGAPSLASKEQIWTDVGYSLLRYLNAMWLTFKEEAWASEAEFRCVYHVFDQHLPDWCEIKTRPGTGRRYFEADFRPVDLKYVGIGPRNEPRSTREWVEQLLEHHGYRGVHIERSTSAVS